MKKLKYIIALVFTIFAINLCVTSVPADLGNHNSYSSHSSGSSHSYGGSSYGGYSSGYRSGYRSYGSTGGSTSAISWVIAVAIVVIVVILSKNKASTSGSNSSAPVQRQAVPDRTRSIVELITKNDPAFSQDKFIGWAKEVFITLQMAWSERDFSKVRPFEKEELYRQHVMQIQEYINLGRINVLSRINVNRAYFTEYKVDNQYEYLTMYLEARMGDYIKDEKTGAVIKGDPNVEYEMRYLLTFIRKTGVLTDSAKSNNSTVACPHCGAPTQITSAGQCEYCGFIVTTGEYDWVLSNIDSIQG